jgi:hypothetical protein
MPLTMFKKKVLDDEKSLSDFHAFQLAALPILRKSFNRYNFLPSSFSSL